MKNMNTKLSFLRRIWRLIKNKYFLMAVAAAIIVIVIISASGGDGAAKLDSALVMRGDVKEEVSVTGKIISPSKSDLSFGKSGVLSRVLVSVGDRVSKGDIIAELDTASDRASLAAAEAKLADMTRSLRPEELIVEKTKVDSAKTSLENAEKDAFTAARQAYVQAVSAINSTDIMFNNPQSANPTINIPAESANIQTSINWSRAIAGDKLNQWKNDLSNITDPAKTSDLIARSNSYLSEIKMFVNSLATIINRLVPGSSGLSQTAISNYVSIMNTSQSTLNQSISTITGADSALRNARTNYDQVYSAFVLRNAGSSAEAIEAQRSAVAAATAELNKGRLIAPVDGIITKSDPKVGEFVSVGNAGFAIMGQGAYSIEAYVPEADIAKVSVGNSVEITLDAYGSDAMFAAKVVSIDPAETIIEGVPTYKVTSRFDDEDERVRSGMTANMEIQTRQKTEVLYIPSRAVIDEDGQKIVRILNKDGETFEKTPVITGLKGSNGTIEIVSGLVEGQRVVTYVK